MAIFVFDFDGVLIHSRNPDKTYVWNDVVQTKFQIPISLLQNLFAVPVWTEVLCGKIQARDLFESVLRKHQPALPVDDFIQAWLTSDLKWYPEVLDFAANLKSAGHRLFVGTNQDHVRGKFLQRQEAIQNLFEEVLYSADFGFMKPNTEFFKQAATQIRPENEKIFLIDDRLENIEAANAFGWRGIHFDPDLTGASIEKVKKRLLKEDLKPLMQPNQDTAVASPK
jgi:putative hydrolase of the HAD superfamily